ncbi:MAG: DUF2130 domain-containing protein [Clostridiales bacterium]|nr:DUF2130 domain-containing protein [Clostridiales bacterium]
MDNEIKCPSCGQVFKVDESGYASILKQVRDHEFEKELKSREDKDLQVELMKQDKLHQEDMSKKAEEISDLQRQIEQLKAQINNAQTEKELAVTKATQEKERELSDKNNEIIKLKGDIDLQKKEGELEKNNLIEVHKGELKLRDEEIERLKDFKAKQSTKMVGESLEQHCMNQFNQIRMAAFPNAEFGKDNDASSGSKGDFIYRESSDGVEFISIMFEMKNEMDTTATKHKNEDFFKELDKDRREKKCEYAVLVSLLEADNELYNNGIVDVSYQYEKMFVVRPQFFIPIISLLRNAALNSLVYRKQLAEIQSQQVDLYNFENNLLDFKGAFGRSVELAGKNYNKAIDDIQKAIDNLKDVKDKLELSMKQLNQANNKLEDISIKKLTKNAPSVKQMFDDISKEEN